MTSETNWPFIPNGDNTEIVRTKGAYLERPNGTQILDAAGGAIVANIGHGRTRVAKAVAEATLNCTFVVPPWITPQRQELVERLQTDWLPEELSRIHLTCGGSEAVETAMKIALQYQCAKGEEQRTNIIGRTLSYHGTTLATTAVGGHTLRKAGLVHALEAYPRVQTPYPLRCPLGAHHPDATQYYLDEFAECINRLGAETIAAYLAEPIIGSSGGAIVPPDGYWEGIRKMCDDNGILLLLDEVMTGFGRTGKNFGYQHWPITPDILVSGKGLAGGYAPIAGVFSSDHIANTIGDAHLNVMFHTYAAHPAACAAAVEVLDILKEENLVNRAHDMGNLLNTRLTDAFSNHPHIAEIRGSGLLQAIEIVQNRDNLEAFPAEQNVGGKIVKEAMRRNVFFYGGGNGDVRDIICMGPPFIITEKEIDTMVSVLLDSVDAVCGG